MSAITKILTSAAVVGALITGLFGWTNNRTNNSLNYITDERKRWRDKIREISEAIETCKFHGEDKENINVYLLQLENNINPYGRFQPSDYEHDGHIWEVIGKIERAENEEEFKKYQKELLSYLQLLLKEDWERSKKEVKGYSPIKSSIIFCMTLATLLAIYYFGVLKLKDIYVFWEILTLALGGIAVLFEYIQNRQNKNGIKIMGLVVEEIILVLAFCMILYEGISENIIQNVSCYQGEDEKSVFVYMNSNHEFFPNIEKNIEDSIKKEVEMLDENKAEGKKECTPVEKIAICREIKYTVTNYSIFILLVIIAIFATIQVINMLEFKKNVKKRNDEVEKIKNKNALYQDRKKEVEKIHKKIVLQNKEEKKECRELLDIMSSLLADMGQEQQRKANKMVTNLAEYEERKEGQEKLEKIQKARKKIKKARKHPKKYEKIMHTLARQNMIEEQTGKCNQSNFRSIINTIRNKFDKCGFKK